MYICIYVVKLITYVIVAHNLQTAGSTQVIHQVKQDSVKTDNPSGMYVCTTYVRTCNYDHTTV